MNLLKKNVASKPPLVVILLGPPGSGKGTQASMLKDKLQIPHISTGELLRAHIRRETPLGMRAKTYIDQGLLGPDDLVLDMLFQRITESDCAGGYILDGFPRTLMQAEALQERLQVQPIVINLNLADQKIIERLTKRLICERCATPFHLIYSPPQVPGVCDKCRGKLIQRTDDTEAVIIKRLSVYHAQTAPLIAFYSARKLLHTVDCDQSKEKIFSEVISKIGD